MAQEGALGENSLGLGLGFLFYIKKKEKEKTLWASVWLFESLLRCWWHHGNWNPL